eukprot:scaffold1824_cov332-Prasinococcus_capsulatus_cf.AAC.12
MPMCVMHARATCATPRRWSLPRRRTKRRRRKSRTWRHAQQRGPAAHSRSENRDARGRARVPVTVGRGPQRPRHGPSKPPIGIRADSALVVGDHCPARPAPG